MIGIVTRFPDHVFQRLVASGVRSAAEPAGVSVRVYEPAALESGGQPLLHRDGVRGLLVIANALSDALLTRLHAAGLPISLISHHVAGLPLPMVRSNNAQGVRALVRHLVDDCGRRTLIFVAGVAGQSDANEREAAFRLEAMRYNLVTPAIIRGDFDADIAARAVERLLETGALFDGMIAADYVMGMAAVRVLRERGLAVPDAVSVAGFGDAPDAADAGLTTVKADVVELGRRAAFQLLSQMRGETIRGVTSLSVALVVRATTLPAPPPTDSL